MSEGLKRYEGKELLPLESHNSADLRSGRIGDIDIVNNDGSSFEAVEVKLGIAITAQIAERAKEKILRSSASRYYILSTAPVGESEKPRVDEIIRQVANVHGCQLIVNGIVPTLKYYLRLLDSTVSFLAIYASLVFSDESIKYERRERWNELVSGRE